MINKFDCIDGVAIFCFTHISRDIFVMRLILDAETWKILGQVGGIGGISLGVFLMLFREIIRKNIFPTLKREDGYRLMRLITLSVWSVALAGIGAWLISTRLPDQGLSQQTLGLGSPIFNNTHGDITVTTTTTTEPKP